MRGISLSIRLHQTLPEFKPWRPIDAQHVVIFAFEKLSLFGMGCAASCRIIGRNFVLVSQPCALLNPTLLIFV
jgi:hypothetical protein